MKKGSKKKTQRKKPKTYLVISKTPKSALMAKNFLPAYLALERPNTTHLFFSKGLADFLLGLVIGGLIGMVMSVYLRP